MEIQAINKTPELSVNELMAENPIFYDLLTDLSGHNNLIGIELFREDQDNIHTARFKTHGYGIVIAADVPKDNNKGYMYAIAKPLFTDPNADDMIQLLEGPMTFSTLDGIKDSLIETLIIK